MYRIKTLNKISSAGLAHLDQTRFQVGNDVENEDGILVRSAAMHEYEFPQALRAIARAGAGTNNIPIDRCSENGIVVFNTPGANANAVKELVIAAMLIASRDIMGGAKWVQEQANTEGVDVAAAVEKGKSAFVGPELYKKTLGVIGLGAIGALVCNVALDLGMDVYGYDPFLSVDAALRLDRHVHVVKDVNELYKVADYVTIHVPYNNDTKDFINAEAISKMKGQVRVLNLARGGLVNDDDMIEALNSGRVAKYVTDFPDNKITTAKNVIALPHLGASTPESEENCAAMAAQELRDYLVNGNITNSVNLPNVSQDWSGIARVCIIHKNVPAMPHLGASTPESEENCAAMAAQELRDYLVNGNITNSVNLPNVSQDWSGIARVCIIHKNVPAMLTKIMATLSDDNINVENMTNKSKKDYAYTMVDVNTRISDQVADELRAIEGVIRVRVLNH